MPGLFDLHGGEGDAISGLESRTLRALLHLERRHVAVLAQIVGEADATTARVTQWEVSKGRGYPPVLVAFLQDLEQAVGEMASDLHGAAEAVMGEDSVTLLRPRGAMRIMALLRLPAVTGRRFTDDELDRLAEDGGDFWQRLCDAAVTRCALSLKAEGHETVRVVFDHRPDPEA